MDKEAFSKRLAQLRMAKGVSARDMSLSLGQSPAYINNVENGVSLPSMAVFFYICDYLEISPSEFFDIECADPAKLHELMSAAKRLDSEKLNHLVALIRYMK